MSANELPYKIAHDIDTLNRSPSAEGNEGCQMYFEIANSLAQYITSRRPAAIPTGEGLTDWRDILTDDEKGVMLAVEHHGQGDGSIHSIRAKILHDAVIRIAKASTVAAASSTGAQAEAVSDWLKKQKRFGWTKDLVEHLEKTGWPSDKMMVEEDTIGQFIMHTYYPETKK